MKNILVIDDSALMRRIVCDIINSDSRFYVKDTAADGVIALKLLENNKYDAVILDINMPKMNGLEFLKELRRKKITQRIIIFSTDTSKGAAVTIEALELGALDFIQKPAKMTDSNKKQFRELFLQILVSAVAVPLDRIQIKGSTKSKDTFPDFAEIGKAESSFSLGKTLEKENNVQMTESVKESVKKSNAVNISAKDSGSTGDVNEMERKNASRKKADNTLKEIKNVSAKDKKTENNKKHSADLKPSDKLVVIACSTGGPKALQKVIPYLPENLDAPVLIVQHMPSGFTATLAQRLDMISTIPCTEAQDKEDIHRGHVYIAAGGKHLKYAEKPGQSVYYSDEPPREGVKPCANYLFESLIDSSFKEIVCVVMTGMGADGTKGIVALHEHKKLHIIAQDETSCTVYGMPKCITDTGLVNQIVDLDHIAQEIILKVGVK